MKKILLLITPFIILSSACSRKDASKTTITWAVGKDATGAQQKLAEIFMKRNPDCVIKIIEMPGSANAQRDSYVTYLAARDSSIDIYSIDIIWPAEFAAAGWLLSLNDLFPINEQRKFLPGPINGCKYKNNIYAVPWFTDAGVLYYRKDLLTREKLSTPKTWNELINQAKLLQKKYKIHGFVFQAQQYEGLVCNFLEYLWSYGGSLVNKKGELYLKTQTAKSALKLWYDIIHTHKIAPQGVLTYQEEESRQLFTSGQAAFLRNWPYVWTLAQDKEKSKVAGLVGIAPLPGTSKSAGASTLGGWNLAISKFSPNPKKAWKFIEFLTCPEAQKMYAIQGGRLPTRKSVYKDKDVLSFAPYYRSFYSVFINARPRPATPSYSQMSDVLQIELHKALTNQQSIDETLKNVQF